MRRPRFTFGITIAISFAWTASRLLAQTDPEPDQDPSGQTGVLKANVQTGCGYNAHSGNGTRSVTDLHVPGALGEYGLDFTRHWNSIPPEDNFKTPTAMPFTDFGTSGWTHSWNWSATVENELPRLVVGGDGNNETDNKYRTSITITFPDGRVSKFTIVRLGVGYGGAQGRPYCGPPYDPSYFEKHWPVPVGLYDRLEDMAVDGSEFWLHLADGGSVHFVGASWSGSAEHKEWTYEAREVQDPYGFKTTLQYTNGFLTKVLQEGGQRWLTINWGYSIQGSVAAVINSVQSGGASGTQKVNYTYAITGYALTLRTVEYLDNPQVSCADTGCIKASYIYENSSLKEADDPRFAGPMTRIRYKYRGDYCHTPPPPDPTYKYLYYAYAQAQSVTEEQSPYNDGSGNPIFVSRFAIHCADGTRTEWNGLGGWRKFYYGHSTTWPGSGSRGHELAMVTDFTHTGTDVPSERQSHLNGRPHQLWDARGIMTQLGYNDGSNDLPSEVRHAGADNSFRSYNRVNYGASAPRDPARIHNPYNHWLFSQTDERFQTTTYRRDSRRRITKIDYPGGSFEEFGYNEFNQVLWHRQASGAVRHYDYNGLNQLWREWNSVDGEGNATIYTYYGPGNHPEWTGLVQTAQNARARANGKPFSAKMEYNTRQQVTKVTYPATGPGADPFVTYAYDQYGNCTSITNELGEQSRYTYDDYRRCTSYTEPLNAPNWNGGPNVPERTWHWTYDRVRYDNVSISASAHTSKEWRLQIEPPYDAAGNRRAKMRNYDYNNLLVFEYDSLIQAPNGAWTYPADAATHSYTYDENGQKKTYTDPLSRLTRYEYDLRNRLWLTIEPLDRTTETLYDTTGNKTDVTFPDDKSQHWRDYDGFGQAGRFIDERNNTTNLTYQWGPMKKLQTVTTYRDKDGGGTEPQRTTFYYTDLGLPQTTVFPDGSEEWSFYEFGQLKHFWTREEQLKTIVYDERGREKSHSWVGDAAPAVSRVWDKANRLTSISNLYSTIDYTYDDAGQVITEGNTITGASAGRRDTIYWRYPNGAPAHIIYPNGWRSRRDYTYRGQLQATGQDNASGVWTYKLGEYAYFRDGNVQTETAYNGVQTHYGYDGRGQIRATNTQRASTTPAQRYSYRTYTRDTRDRISAWYKSNSATYNVLENGRGDRYGYDAEGQLTAVSYEALTPAGTPTGAKRTESFVYDALGNRKGTNVVAGRGAVTFYRRDNGLNQYSSWTPSVMYYDDNFPGWAGGWPGNGVMMAEGYITASYNALNQPVAIWSPATGASNYMWFGFDPLGRCVKRWVGPSSTATTATYLYYDGWNLIQEGTGAAAAERIYVHGNRVDRIVSHYNYAHTRWRYHHYDARGHCILVTDPNGTLIEQYEYDAFGKPYFYNASNGWTSDTGDSAFGNRFLFTGREWLSDLKLYDYRHRLYQPELGRFLQPDPKQFEAGDYNLYRYCHNDPVNKTDPTGLDVDANLHDRSTEQFISAQHLPEKRAEFSLAAHGNSSAIQDARGETPRLLGAESAVKAISSMKGFAEAKTIRLFVCDGGKGDNSIAQKIANITGKTVIAPTKFIWTDVKGGHSIYGATRDPKTNELVKNLKDKGEWKSFRPEKR